MFEGKSVNDLKGIRELRKRMAIATMILAIGAVTVLLIFGLIEVGLILIMLAILLDTDTRYWDLKEYILYGKKEK